MSRLDRLTALGSGGGQIAFHSAFKGKTVVLRDIAVEAIAGCQAAAKQHLPFTNKLATAR